MKKKQVIKTVGSVALTLTILFGGAVFSLKQNEANYSSTNQIETIANALDCDLSYLKNNQKQEIFRMKHNNGEPIYVSISNKFTETESKHINSTLDYVFDIVGSINNNYRYEIVDNNKREEFADKGNTTIAYEVGEATYQSNLGEDRSHSIIYRNSDSKSDKKPLYNNYKIIYDQKRAENLPENEIHYTFLHELLHAFGFEDVYNITKMQSFTPTFYGNTIMNGSIGDKINHLTPNDYKCIIATYAPKMNEQELYDFINKYKQKVSNYDETYYKTFAVLCKHKTQINSTLNTSKSYQTSYTRKLTNDKGETIIEKTFLNIENGQYQLTITDNNGNILEHAEGKTFNYDNTIILKSVKLNKGLRPITEKNNIENYINDLALMQDEKGNIIFYDFATNDINNMKEDIQEKEIEPEM